MDKRMKTFIGVMLIIVGLGVFYSVSQAKPAIVTDEAHIMIITNMRANQLDDYHNELLRLYDIDFRVYTANNMGDIDSVTNKKFRELKVGSLSKTGHGVLFAVDPIQNRARMEVSAGLEGVFPDAFVSYIERKNMVEYFKVGQIPEGIVSSTQFVFDRAKENASGLAFDAGRLANVSIGAGAQVPARINAGKSENIIMPSDAAIERKLEPLEAFMMFLNAMKQGEMRYDPLIFTKQSLAMVRGAVIPPALVEQTYKKFSSCTVDAVKINGDYAVIRFLIQNHQCMPYFMKKEDGLWKFDLPGMTAITSNFEDVWAINADAASNYMFAFEDWRMESTKSLSTGRTFLVPVASNN